MPSPVDIQINNTILLSIFKTDGSHITVPSRYNNMKIASGSVSLKSSIVDNELVFGQPIASEFSCEIFNLEDDLSGYQITAYLQDITNLDRTAIFTGFIDSCTTDLLGGSRKIIAYDWFYYHRDDNIIDIFKNTWYNEEVEHKITTVANARNDLVRGLGFSLTSGSFINDGLYIGGIPKSVIEEMTSITVAQYLQMICELQCTFPHINGAGNLEFIKLNIGTVIKDGDSYTLNKPVPYYLDDTNYEKSNTTREEFTTKPIPYMKIYESSDKVIYNRAPSTLPNDASCYSISGNILLNYRYDDPDEKEERSAYFKELTDNMLHYCLQWIQYLPNKTKMIISDFSLTLGTYYRFDNIISDCYIMSIELSGECLIEQTISCIAKSETLSNKAATKNDSLVQNNNNISTNSKIESVKEDLTNNYYDKTAANNKFPDKNETISEQTEMYLATYADSDVVYEDDPHWDPRWGHWTSTVQYTDETNRYLWMYEILTYADGSTSRTLPSIRGVYGEPGPQGIQGNPGEDAKVYSINSDNQWVYSGRDVDNHRVYQSDSSYHVRDGESRCVISVKGYTSFTLYACSDGEFGYDYLRVSKLDATTIVKDDPNNPSDSSYKYTFRRTASSSTNFIAITFDSTDGLDTGEHIIRLLYGKDGSVDSGTDRAYFYIADGIGINEGNAGKDGTDGAPGNPGASITESIPLYYVSDSSTYPAKPSTPIGEVDSYNRWSTKMKEVTDTYGWVFTCTQNKYSTNTYTWSDVTIDQSSRYSFVQIQDLKDRYVLKVDNNGNVVTCELGANPSSGSWFNINADNIYFVANKTLDIKTSKLGITGDCFSITAGTGELILNADYLDFVANKTINLKTKKIGISADCASIEAGTGKLTINADYLNFVANKTIDLKTGKIGINSDNFKIDAVTGLVDIVGSLTCRDGQISISKNNEEYAMKVETHEGSSKIDYKSYSQSGDGVVNEYTNSVSGEFFEFFNPTSTYGQVSILTNYLYVKSGITANSINTPYIGAAEGDIQTIYTNNLNVSNDATITGKITSAGNIQGLNLKATNNLNVSNDATITGKITSASDIQGLNLKATNNLTVSNNATITGNLTAANIGKYVTKYDSWPTTSIANASLTKLGYITLDKGIWIVAGKIQLSGSASLGSNQRLQIGIFTDTSSMSAPTNILTNSVLGSSTSGAGINKVGTTTILNIDSDNTRVYLYGYQNTGSAQNINTASTGTYLRAVRIK